MEKASKAIYVLTQTILIMEPAPGGLGSHWFPGIMNSEYVTGHWPPLRTFHLVEWTIMTVKVCAVANHEFIAADQCHGSFQCY